MDLVFVSSSWHTAHKTLGLWQVLECLLYANEMDSVIWWPSEVRGGLVPIKIKA